MVAAQWQDGMLVLKSERWTNRQEEYTWRCWYLYKIINNYSYFLFVIDMFHEQVLINAYKYPNDKACMNLKYFIVVCGINWCEHTFFYQLFFNLNFSFGGKHMLYFFASVFYRECPRYNDCILFYVIRPKNCLCLLCRNVYVQLCLKSGKETT